MENLFNKKKITHIKVIQLQVKVFHFLTNCFSFIHVVESQIETTVKVYKKLSVAKKKNEKRNEVERSKGNA